ncbi:DUF452 family protein [Parabacteroides chongii]|uniref:DUF452 family protein n=1 Tax=Parabacteroides chongii TaxID=2685834 RepID=UPI00240D3E35|nr:pimeloyl-ACP methyl esterase BioG family protein [Parabacteroides chongii]WFE82898.1 DUF452 family protein [Parabacteroides chongii]
MKIIKQTDNHAARLLLFFSGWSASPKLFTRLETREETDIMLCYDYRETAFEEDLSRYDEIHLVAWSMGVRMAECALTDKYTLTSATAINGTSRPIHDAYGIPEKIFKGTLDNLTAEGLRRFNRRMCGTREILARYDACPPRPLEEVKEELEAIYNRFAPSTDTADKQFPWTRAVIGSDDHIFPVANQHAWWDSRCPVTEITAPHYPFYLWKQWNEL